MPVGLSWAARPITIIAARHDIANARLLCAVVVVVGDEDVAKAVNAWLVFVAEVVRDQFQVLAVEVAAPDGACLAVGVVGGPLAALAVGALQAMDARIADAEIEFTVRADENAVDAVVAIEAAETAEQFLWGPVGFAVTIFVFKKQNVRRMADVDFVTWPDWILSHGDTQGREKIGRLIEGGDLVGSAGPF